MDKDTKKILAEAERQGFSVKLTKKGHSAVYRDSVWITTFAGTSSDHRSMLNGLAAMKRSGFRWPLQKGRKAKPQ